MATTRTAPAPATRIDVRSATSAAARYFQQLYPNVSDFSLEEVELSEDENYWLITLSFDVAWKAVVGLSLQLSPPRSKFKVFKVHVRTGEVVSMKNRKLE